jgi:hypothetical protein
MMRLALLALVLAGCGGGGAMGTSSLFGTWTVTSGSTTDTCPGSSPTMTDDTSSTVVVSKNPTDPTKVVLTVQVVPAPAPTCTLNAAISGSSATLDAGQSCTVFSHSFMFQSGTLATQDGATGAWSATFVNYGPPPGNSVCNDASSDTLKRTSTM